MALHDTHPIWTTPEMRDAIASGNPGAIVRLARRAADLTQTQLGTATGYTAASISRMERGKQPMRDMLLLTRIAEVLNIPPQLLGLAARHAAPPGPVGVPRPLAGGTRVAGRGVRDVFGDEGEGEDRVRRRNLLAGIAGTATGTVLGGTSAAHAGARPALTGLEDLLLHRGGTPAGEPTRTTVTAAVDASRRDFGTCRYDTLARALPSRIALAQSFGREHPDRQGQSATAVAELYSIATRLCIKLGEDGLAAVTADRALTAALSGAGALTVAEAHRMVSSSWRRQGHYARATDVAVTAAQQLAADRTTPEPQRLSVQGNLYATAAYTAAKQGDRQAAHTLIAEAQATARRLGADQPCGRNGVLRPEPGPAPPDQHQSPSRRRRNGDRPRPPGQHGPVAHRGAPGAVLDRRCPLLRPVEQTRQLLPRPPGRRRSSPAGSPPHRRAHHDGRTHAPRPHPARHPVLRPPRRRTYLTPGPHSLTSRRWPTQRNRPDGPLGHPR